MRALVITGPGSARVSEVEAPSAGPGQVVVDVRRAGICGTDVELFTGQLAVSAQGKTRFPVRPGHEWCGVVSAVGAGVAAGWLGVRVTGDTMLGCGHCARCRAGRGHVCADRYEVGIAGGWPGALAEQVAVPASKLHRLPSGVDDVAGALVEPGGNAWRAASAAGAAPGRAGVGLGAGHDRAADHGVRGGGGRGGARAGPGREAALARGVVRCDRVLDGGIIRCRRPTTRWSTAPTITGCRALALALAVAGPAGGVHRGLGVRRA